MAAANTLMRHVINYIILEHAVRMYEGDKRKKIMHVRLLIFKGVLRTAEAGTLGRFNLVKKGVVPFKEGMRHE